MKRSEKLYGGAVGLIFAVCSSADSKDFVMWTAVAVVCIIGAMLLIRAARKAERAGK